MKQDDRMENDAKQAAFALFEKTGRSIIIYFTGSWEKPSSPAVGETYGGK